MPDVSKHLEKAQKLTLKGRLEEAIQTYLVALQEDPENDPVVEIVADLYQRLGQQPKAIECFTYLFEKQREKGDSARATVVFRKLAKLTTPEPAQYLEFAKLLEKRQPQEAAEIYHNAAEQLRKQGKKAEALEAIMCLANLEKGNSDLQCLLGEAAQDAGRVDVAASAYMRAAEIQKAKSGGQAEAIGLLERAHKISPQNREVIGKLARAYLDINNAKGALGLLGPLAEDDVSLHNLDPEFLKMLAQACLATKDFNKAASALTPLAPTHPETHPLLIQSVQGFLETHQPGLAVDVLRYLKEILFKADQQKKFLELYESIPEALQTSTEVLEFMASIYNQLNFDSQFNASQRKLFDLYFAAGNFLKTADLLEHMVDTDPYDSENTQRLNRLNGKIDNRRYQSIASRFTQFASTPASSASAPASFTPPPPPPQEDIPAIPSFEDPAPASAPANIADTAADAGNWPDLSSLSGVGEGGEAGAGAAAAGAAPAPGAMPPPGEGNVLEDLILQAEIFMQYGLKARAVERLERIQKVFPGEEAKNQKLRNLYTQAGMAVKEGLAAPAAPKAESTEEATVDFARVSEITRNIFRQSNVKNVLFAAVNDVGRTWKVSKCVAALCLPGKTPSALLEYCATGMKQSEALSLVRLVHATMKLSPDGAPVSIDDAESSTKLAPIAPIVKALGIRSLLALPLMEADQPMGVLVLEQCDNRRRWHSNEVESLRTVADQVVMAASHVKLRSLMKSLSVTDEKSGMLHRTSYIDCLISEAQRTMKQSGSMCVSLVQFGKDNELVRDHGEDPVHKYMDEIGQSLTSHLRQNDVVVKYDSTTLAVVMPDTKGAEALQVMDKMRKLMSTVKLNDKVVPPLTYGLAEPILDPNYDIIDCVTELINRAEDAMAAAHKDGLGSGKMLSPTA